ncbi:MAG: hypothetical protein ACLP1D_25330 [Xanthobacteraceae bacterium]
MKQDTQRFRKSHAQAADQPFGDRATGGPTRSADATTHAAMSQDAAEEVRALRKDLEGLRDAVAAFVSQTAERTARAAQGVASSVADQTGAAASKLADRGTAIASEAADQAKGVAAEFEQLARRNPLGAIAVAAAIGLAIGMMGRRR